MRRFGFRFLILAAVVGMATAAAAAGRGDVRIRPRRWSIVRSGEVVPEPKAPTPAPPVTIFREAIGSFGIGTGSFDEPVDVAIDAGRQFLRARRRQQPGPDVRQFLERSCSTVGSYGSRKGEFNNPEAIAIDPEGFRSTSSTPATTGSRCSPGSRRALPECPPARTGSAHVHSTAGAVSARRAGDFKSPATSSWTPTGNSLRPRPRQRAGPELVRPALHERFVGELGPALRQPRGRLHRSGVDRLVQGALRLPLPARGRAASSSSSSWTGRW